MQESVVGRKAIEAVVQLHRVEVPGIPFEHFPGRYFGGIEVAQPVLVMPSGSANVKLGIHGGIQIQAALRDELVFFALDEFGFDRRERRVLAADLACRDKAA